MKTVFAGQAVKCEMVVLMLEKWNLHPVQHEGSATPHLDDLARDATVMVPDAEAERAAEILYGENEYDRSEF